MATLLYRLGKASYQKAGWVLAAWLLTLVAVAGSGIAFGGQTDEQFRIPGSESQEAFDRLEAVFPTFAGASAQAVMYSPEGTRLDTPENRDYIEQLTAVLDRSPGVDGAVSPFDEFAGEAVSDDGRYAIIQIRFDRPTPEVTEEMVTALLESRSVIDSSDLVVEFGGSIFQDQGVKLTIAEAFGVIFAGLVLIITFRSFRPSWIPLASAIIGVGIAVGLILLMARVITVGSSGPLLAVMLGLAVGIDYSLFIVSRHRTQLAKGEDPMESAATAVGTAGNAVVFAGATVIIALLGLFVVGIPFLSVMGASAAIAVAIAIAAAITLIPALLGLAGEKLRPAPSSSAARIAGQSADKPSMGRRWVRGVTKHPLAVTIITVMGLGVIALPALSLDLNLPGGGQEPRESTQRKAYEMVEAGFGPGFNGPLLIAEDITKTDDIIGDLESLREEFEAIPGLDYVSQGFPSPGLDTAIFQAVPQYAPDSAETKALVAEIRQRTPDIEERYDTAISLTGITAIGVDVSERIQNALIPFGLVVVGLSIILLLSVFRSILVPIKAALGFVLSVTAAFGVVVAIFQWGWLSEFVGVETPGPILSFMPIILMAVLFGLAMDYEVFLVSGMREQHVRTGDWRFAIEEGYANGARVVTAAALIMFFVFFSFVVEGSNLIKPIALGLAVGIAFDAFVVRMTLVPALMKLFGKTAWLFPRALESVVPDADVEGEKLRHHIDDVAWAKEHPGVAVRGDYLVVSGQRHDDQPVSFQWLPGERIDVVADNTGARAFTATVAGLLPQAAGALHILGHPMPSKARAIHTVVSVWNRDDADSLTPLGLGLTERLAWSEATSHWSEPERNRAARDVLAGLNQLSQELSGDALWPTLTKDTLPGVLPRHQQILVWSALAVLGKAPVCLISSGEPVSDETERALWWRGLQHFASGTQVVALFCLPPLRALTRLADHSVLDLGSTRMAGANR
jgi:RND superfamily putative drug exporter